MKLVIINKELKDYKNGLELYTGINFHEGISDCLISLGDVNHQQSNHKEAIRYLNEAIIFNETIGYKEEVRKPLFLKTSR